MSREELEKEMGELVDLLLEIYPMEDFLREWEALTPEEKERRTREAEETIARLAQYFGR